MKILTVGIDKDTRTLLVASGLSTEEADEIPEHGEDLNDYLQDGIYQGCLVDVDKTSLGLYFPRVIRSKKNNIPIFATMSVRESEKWSESRSLFLEQGGDDLLQKPFSVREFIAAFHACHRRILGGYVSVHEYRGEGVSLKVSPLTCVVSINNEVLHFTGQEFKIVLALASRFGQVASKEYLLNSLYTNEQDEAEIKIVDVFLCKIRRKFNDAHSGAGNLIETVWGRGYKLSDNLRRAKVA